MKHRVAFYDCVVQIVASDGSTWDTPREALDREALCVAVAGAMAPLPPIPAGHEEAIRTGAGYFRHDPAAVLAARANLLALARERMPYWAEKKPEMFDPAVHPPCNFIGRILFDSEKSLRPISDAWYRLCCVDAAGREWGQQYYAEHFDPEATPVGGAP